MARKPAYAGCVDAREKLRGVVPATPLLTISMIRGSGANAIRYSRLARSNCVVHGIV